MDGFSLKMQEIKNKLSIIENTQNKSFESLILNQTKLNLELSTSMDVKNLELKTEMNETLTKMIKQTQPKDKIPSSDKTSMTKNLIIFVAIPIICFVSVLNVVLVIACVRKKINLDYNEEKKIELWFDL